MKFILILVALNLANPQEPMFMLHKAFPSEQECRAAIQRIQTENPPPPSVRASAYCVSENDLLEINPRTTT